MRQTLRSLLLWRHRIFAAYLRVVIPAESGPGPLLPPQEVASILVLRLDEIGDFVLTTPFLRALRVQYARARITLLVRSAVATLARACPYVDEVVELPRWGRVLAPFDQVTAYIRARRFARAHLLERKFQYAINPRVDIDITGALAMAYFARIPYRIGYGESGLPIRKIKDAGYDAFLTHRVAPPQGNLHDAASALRVAQFCGAPIKDDSLQLWPGKQDAARVAALLEGFRQGGRGLIAMAPGASHGRRRWPIAAFASLAAQLTARFAVQVVVVGGPEDVALGQLIEAQSNSDGHVLSLAGRLSLQESAALLGCCAVFVGNDSGPMHMAAAMGVPVVEISSHAADGDPVGSNSPTRFAPWGVAHRVLQPLHAIQPCDDGCTKSYAHCIKMITTDQVLRAVQELLPVPQSRVERVHEPRVV
jgi:heptosyltransferase-2